MASGLDLLLGLRLAWSPGFFLSRFEMDSPPFLLVCTTCSVPLLSAWMALGLRALQSRYRPARLKKPTKELRSANSARVFVESELLVVTFRASFIIEVWCSRTPSLGISTTPGLDRVPSPNAES